MDRLDKRQALASLVWIILNLLKDGRPQGYIFGGLYYSITLQGNKILAINEHDCISASVDANGADAATIAMILFKAL